MQTEQAPVRRNPIVRFFAFLWGAINSVRKVLHLLLLLMIFGVFFGAVSTAPVGLPATAALVIEPYGALVEQLEGDPYDRALAELLGDGTPQTRVQDVIDALAYAAEDNRIETVHLELSSFGGGGLAKLERVAQAMLEFKTSGKPIIASGDFMSQSAYYLAAHADEVYLHPYGLVLFQGYGRYGNYFKDALDLLRIDWNIFRVGTHKSFVEPYTRMDMSDEDKESTRSLIDQLWLTYQTDIEQQRGLEPGTVDEFAQNLVEHVGRNGGDIGSALLEAGFVDDLLQRDAIRDRLIELVGTGSEADDTYARAGMRDYLAQMQLLSGGPAAESNVAIVVAAGDIMFGNQPPGTIGGDSTAALLREALNDESVNAVVLRVDSPGGSMFAAEVIAQEIRELRNAGKPVVASMASVAASGGYQISVVSDRVLANESTITGSIGIFGMFPTWQRTAETVGVSTDGIGTTPWSGQFRPDRAMSDESKQLFQLFIEDGYDDFISDVAANRGMDKAVVDSLAQGRVWTGADALSNGLIDEIGDLNEAVQVAAELAGIDADDYGVFYVEPQLSPSEQFLLDLMSATARRGIDIGAWLPNQDGVRHLLSSLNDAGRWLQRFNDPRGLYTHCLCAIE